jgi:hypothetical protein
LKRAGVKHSKPFADAPQEGIGEKKEIKILSQKNGIKQIG